MPSSSDTPPNLRNSSGWQFKHMEKLMDAKLDSIKTSIRAIEKEVEDTKKIASKPHECSQEHLLETLTHSVEDWTKWWRRMMITIITSVIGLGAIAGGWWYSHAQVQGDVNDLKVKVEDIETGVENIGAAQVEIQKSLNRTATFRTSGEQKEIMKEAFREVVEEQKRRPRK